MPFKLLRIATVLLVLLILNACTQKPDYSEPVMSEDRIKIEISGFKEGHPKFYSYRIEDKKIDYFLVLVKDKVESYFDACKKCNPQKKGFRFAEGRLVCLACGENYHINQLKGIGSCYPIPLKGSLEGSHYVINREDMIKGASYF